MVRERGKGTAGAGVGLLYNTLLAAADNLPSVREPHHALYGFLVSCLAIFSGEISRICVRTSEVEDPDLLSLVARHYLSGSRCNIDGSDDMIMRERVNGLSAICVPYFPAILSDPGFQNSR